MTADSDTTGPPVENAPGVLRRAMEFIDEYIHYDIALDDIADAAGASSRMLQYVFRRECGCTPMQYVRKCRLYRAHLELVSGDRTTSTVGQIARNWKFGHVGRFAVEYRQSYGQHPSATLHSGPREHDADTDPQAIVPTPVKSSEPLNIPVYLDDTTASYLATVSSAARTLNPHVDAGPAALVRLALHRLTRDLALTEVIAELHQAPEIMSAAATNAAAS